MPSLTQRVFGHRRKPPTTIDTRFSNAARDAEQQERARALRVAQRYAEMEDNDPDGELSFYTDRLAVLSDPHLFNNLNIPITL